MYFKNKCHDILGLLIHYSSRKIKFIFLTIEHIELVKFVVSTVNLIMFLETTRISNVFFISKELVIRMEKAMAIYSSTLAWKNPMDGGAWWAAVHGVATSQTRLSDFTFTLHFHALEKEMAAHSSVLAWRIPRTGEPGGLLSMGSHRARHD